MYYQISFDNRFDKGVPGQTVFVTLDGTDFPLNEVTPMEPAYFHTSLRMLVSGMMLH